MSYIRTDEIKEKQRKKMKKRVLSYDWDAIIKKRKQTLETNGTKTGRKKGDGPKRTGIYQECPICSSEFYVIKSRMGVAKYCSRNCMVSDPEYSLKLKEIDKSYMKTESYAKATRDPNRPKYKQYQREVGKLTEENYAKNIEIINPDRVPRTLAGVSGGYQLDHKISVRYGFDNNIEISVIASPENLQMLPWLENVKKGK
ncbi:MAG: hypothetical protein [Caudoviricetes sp.]|nr:MAG: hypothetical protein [Caudoviricetes sp.]